MIKIQQQTSGKSYVAMILLCFFLGGLGIHRKFIQYIHTYFY
ncbi:NINE protein [Lysinibacillus sp. NPDC056232]